MEQNTESKLEDSKTKNPKTKKENKEISRSKNLDPESAKVFQSIKDKVNKKEFGRRVTDSEILAVAIRLISAEHIKKLQDESLSERDRLNMAHQDYVKANGKITLDQYIGKLMRGEIKIN